MKIYFLSYEQVISIHEDQIKRYGGRFGLRDKNLLYSALSQPKITFKGKFLHPTVFQMASAYLFHIVCNHPFIDGNKRTGIVSSLVFLDINDVEMKLTNIEIEKNVLLIAQGKMKKNEISKWLQAKVINQKT